MDCITRSLPGATADQNHQQTGYRLIESSKDADAPFLLAIGRKDREREGEHTSLDKYRHSQHSPACNGKYAHFSSGNAGQKSPRAGMEVQ